MASTLSRHLRKALSLIILSILITICSLLYFHRQHISFQTFDRQYTDFEYLVSAAAAQNPTRNKSPKTFEGSINETKQGVEEVDTQILQDVKDAVLNKNESTKFCFPYNTQAWLNAESSQRLGNINDSRMDADYVFKSIINLNDITRSQTLLGQSLCHKKSRFLSLDTTDIQDPSEETIKFWSLRLIYLATHIHQHLPAFQEAQARLERSKLCQSELQSRAIGSFDFECPSSKFLVVSMGRMGIGAVMRLGAVNAFVAGIASNRTVIFVNNSPLGPKFIRQKWRFASCPRHDLQCFYLPPSPCVLTAEQIQNATNLERSAVRQLFKTGGLPEELADERVLLADIVLRPQREPLTFRNNTVKLIQSHIIEPLIRQNPVHPLINLLTKAVDRILEPEELEDGTFYYFGHNVRHHRALVFYAMRPNLMYAERLDHIMDQTFKENFDPNLAFGLPIRSSDKCHKESECLSFSQYMDLMGQTWTKYEKELVPLRRQIAAQSKEHESSINTAIIVTSEASEVRQAQAKYEREGFHKNLSFPFQFINNDFDLHQGSGNPSRMAAKNKNISLDEVMLSSISSLKAQLHARYSFGNCCSNFHLLLFDFLNGGCGAAQNQVAQCLQENEDPMYRLCCEWTETEECLAKRNGTAKRKMVYYG